MILVTGATGFVGRPLVAELLKFKKSIRILTRRPGLFSDKNIEEFLISDILDDNLEKAFKNIDLVFHLSARVHNTEDNLTDSFSEYMRINAFGTLNILKHAAKSKVKRFIFLSTIKVNGESTLPGNFFYADDLPNPNDSYSVSKFEAEKSIINMCHSSGMEFVIVRPPLVYGKNAKGNFRKLINVISKKIPLPFGAITNNRRSIVGIKNLIDFLLLCSQHPNAKNQIFLIKDNDDFSTNQLIKEIGTFLNKNPYIFYVPIFLLKITFILLRKNYLKERLLASLRIDIGKNEKLLSWTPKYSFLDCMGPECD